MDKRFLLSLLLVACSIDENANGDGGLDGSTPDANDAAIDVKKDVAVTDAGSDVVTVTCDAGTSCGSANDCPTPASVCITRTCADGCCGTVFAATGVPCNEDGGHVCDGTGACVACNVPSDCPATNTVCLAAGCSTQTCSTTPAPTGTACTNDGGTVCDGTGFCVACNQATDCPATKTTCLQRACSNNDCANNAAPVGTACNDDAGLTVCDGTGVCVQCNQTSDCNDAGTCVNNHCQ